MVNGSTLINELQQLTTAQAAPAIINAAQIELINKKFNDEGSKQSTILQLQLDPFSGSTVDELASAKTFDAITQEAFVVHNNITHFVRRALEENPDFGQLGYTDKMAILNGYATEQIGVEAAPFDMNVADQPVEISEERLKAQANLKGTVGGVQGILEIQGSVSKGITDRAAAIALLVEIYGFTTAQSEAIVGNPKPIEQIGDANTTVSTNI